MGFISKIVKSLQYSVSGDKYRYQDGIFDLDLTYITDNVVAMGFPGESVAKSWRNSIDDVSKFLNSRHGNNYWIFNLSGETYNYRKFNYQVSEYGFPDHHAPPLSLLYRIVRAMDDFLSKDPKNVAVVHCLAGRSRTGTIICAYFLFKGVEQDTESALYYFNSRRSLNGQDVVLPSQIRYVHYFERVIRGEKQKMDMPAWKEMKQIVISQPLGIDGRSKAGAIGYWCPYVVIHCLNNPKNVYLKKLYPKMRKEQINEIVLDVNATFSGDVQIRFYHVSSNPIKYAKCYFKLHGITINTTKLIDSDLHVPLFRITFNTSFLSSNHVSFDIDELDAPLAGPVKISEKYLPKNTCIFMDLVDATQPRRINFGRNKLKRSNSVHEVSQHSPLVSKVIEKPRPNSGDYDPQPMSSNTAYTFQPPTYVYQKQSTIDTSVSSSRHRRYSTSYCLPTTDIPPKTQNTQTQYTYNETLATGNTVSYSNVSYTNSMYSSNLQPSYYSNSNGGYTNPSVVAPLNQYNYNPSTFGLEIPNPMYNTYSTSTLNKTKYSMQTNPYGSNVNNPTVLPPPKYYNQ